MPFDLGPLEIVVILVIIFVIFGAGKLPEAFGSMGKALRAFKEGQQSPSETASGKPIRKKRKATRASSKPTRSATLEETCSGNPLPSGLSTGTTATEKDDRQEAIEYPAPPPPGPSRTPPVEVSAHQSTRLS